MRTTSTICKTCLHPKHDAVCNIINYEATELNDHLVTCDCKDLQSTEKYCESCDMKGHTINTHKALKIGTQSTEKDNLDTCFYCVKNVEEFESKYHEGREETLIVCLNCNNAFEADLQRSEKMAFCNVCVMGIEIGDPKHNGHLVTWKTKEQVSRLTDIICNFQIQQNEGGKLPCKLKKDHEGNHLPMIEIVNRLTYSKSKLKEEQKSLIRAMAIQILKFDYDELVRGLLDNKHEFHDQYLFDFYGYYLDHLEELP